MGDLYARANIIGQHDSNRAQRLRKQAEKMALTRERPWP